MRLVLTLLFGSMTGIIGCAQSVRSIDRDAPRGLAALDHQTAWVYLGDIDESSEWATQRRHAVIGRAGAAVIPQIGDVLELESPLELWIPRYQTDGELHRMTAPAGRPLSAEDRTGLAERPPTRLRVADVLLESEVGGLRGMWVRVVPLEPDGD